jgi:hypothetical protein
VSSVRDWVKGPARAIVRSSRLAVDRARWGNEYGRIHENFDHALHIREAAEWLKRGQDAGSDRGVSYGAALGGTFLSSYPETTGYIIPTMLELAAHFQDSDFERRAIEMGDWEISIQMECGAVMGARVDSPPTPAVFNTGQVLLGWSALYRRTGDERYRIAARRAIDWLLECQDPDGNWRRGNSNFADARTTVYNVKAGWGMVEAGLACGWPDAVAGGVRSAEYCISKQASNGWFADCCLGDASRPLLHTIAYSMQGLVGIGRAVGRRDLLEAAHKTADSLAHLMDGAGFIPGRIDPAFQGRVEWCCLTGTAQTSIVWSQLDRLEGSERYAESRRLANRYLMARHNIASQDPAFRGGVFGSWPFWGGYGQNKVLNWAVKFFIDALYLEMTPASHGWVE